MFIQIYVKLLATLFICRAKATIPDKSWSILNETVHGRVRLGSPIARSCFRLSQNVIGEYDEDLCQHIVANYTNREYRASVFDAYMNTQCETCQAASSRCLLDSAEPGNPAAFDPPNDCSQGSVPTHHIVVQTVSDVQASFAFAKSTGINLVIKNTGHDYLGRSSGPNTLALWTHQLQSLSYDQKFVPDGCVQSSEASQAVSFGAGVIYGTLYDFADQMNITLPGGSDRTLGAAGGYLQGGGHSALSNAFGLAVDRVLQFRVVTPSGKYVVANECQNSDLFFALRGGGGGTFGVVLEATMKALPKVSFSVVYATFQGTDDNMKALLKFMVSHSLSYAEQGWGGYILPRENFLLTNPFIDLGQASSDMSALRDFVLEKLGSTFALTTESFSSFFDKYLASSVPVGSPFITASRLIAADKFSDAKSRQVLWERLVDALQNSTFPVIFAVAPYFYDDDGGTSVNSAWRNSIWHVTSSELWSFNATRREQSSIYGSISKSMDALRDFTPMSGAYLNEADVYEPDYEASFWGAHYDRLVSIKKKYDPDQLLDCWRCVNWRGSKDPRYACYL